MLILIPVNIIKEMLCRQTLFIVSTIDFLLDTCIFKLMFYLCLFSWKINILHYFSNMTCMFLYSLLQYMYNEKKSEIENSVILSQKYFVNEIFKLLNPVIFFISRISHRHFFTHQNLPNI